MRSSSLPSLPGCQFPFCKRFGVGGIRGYKSWNTKVRRIIYGFPEEVAAAVAVKICSEESGDLDVQLIAYSPESLQVLQNAPSAKALEQLNGHLA